VNFVKLYKVLLNLLKKSISVYTFQKGLKSIVKKRKTKKANKKNGLEINKTKSAENFETRKKVKYDSEMYQTLQGRSKVILID
jgi:hypothetical protein